MGLFYTHPPCHDPTPLPNAPICTDELQESTKGRGRGSLPVRTSALLAEEGIHVHTYSALRTALVKHGLPWNFHHAAGVLIGVRHNLSIVWKCPYVAASILLYLVCAITKLLDIKHPPPAPDKNGTTCPAPFEAHPPPPLPPPDPNTLVKQTYPTLTFAQLNVGGMEITPNRLCHILSGFLPQPHTISLQEFRPSSTSHIRQHQRVAKYWGYHLLHSTPSRKEGVALLVHTSGLVPYAVHERVPSANAYRLVLIPHSTCVVQMVPQTGTALQHARTLDGKLPDELKYCEKHVFVLLILDLCTLHLCILLLAQWCHGRQRPWNFLAMPSLSEVGELMSEAAELQIGVCGTNLLLLVLPVLPCALSVNFWSET